MKEDLDNMDLDNIQDLPRTPPPARKRGRHDVDDRSEEPSKRSKYSAWTVPTPVLPESTSFSPESRTQKLFFSDSSIDNEPQTAPSTVPRDRSPFVPPGDEDFVLDESLFDFVDADKTLVSEDSVKKISLSALEQSFYERKKAEEESKTPGATGSSTTIGSGRDFSAARTFLAPSFVTRLPSAPDPMSTAASSASAPSYAPVPAPSPEEPDILAELEEWLATTTDIEWK
ncbi:hypothetical protein OF83DRAFT_1218740 [Amylostereum chailletii]|nr:hypothetical protein OF83DRAFT_1218740 [Amylostereum chailletii]